MSETKGCDSGFCRRAITAQGDEALEAVVKLDEAFAAERTAHEATKRELAVVIGERDFARGRAERGDDGRLRLHVEAILDNERLSAADALDAIRRQVFKSPPARYVVKVSGTTKAYDTQAGAETEANALRQNWGINAKVEEK